MSEDITEILPRLDHSLSQFEENATFSLVMKDGDLSKSVTLEGSNHLKLSVMADIAKLETWMRNLPIIGPCNGNWSIAGGLSIDIRTSKASRQYRCTLMNLDISRPASRRIRTAVEMMSGAQERLRDVEKNSGATDLPPALWIVDGKGREERRIAARSAREAAWTYAALYVRNRKDVRNWHATVSEILRVAKLYPEEDWRAARA